MHESVDDPDLGDVESPPRSNGSDGEPPMDVQPSIRVVSALEFVGMELRPRKELLTPFLPEQGLVMVHAERGVGKTFFGMSCAHAVATGSQFLCFNAPESKRVLYLDGEMPATAMQERMIQLTAMNGPDAKFELITPDLQPKNQPSLNLCNPATQMALEPLIKDVSLIVVDNLATLVRGGNSNEVESWLPVQDWALQQRAAGRSVLFIHHSGKNGSQRGTSSREDVLDTVIRLKRPADYLPDQGAVFEVHFEKSRGFAGEDAKPFEARLQTNERGELIWTYKTLELSTYERCCSLANEGLSQKEIASELDINKSTVSRHLRKGRESGDIHA